MHADVLCRVRGVKKKTAAGYMRPKRCRGWEELLYQMERREIKMHRGVEKRFDRRAVGRSTTSGAGAVSAETRAVVECV